MSTQETFSTTELQRMCARSEFLEESDIHWNDKTISWDGNILFYKNKKPKSVGEESFIPIQIKGKEVETLPEKNTISHPVRTKDLRNYLRNGGAIFFVGLNEKETSEVKLYARILLPIDICNLQAGKESQKTIRIRLDWIDSVQKLEQLCALFLENRPKQAFDFNKVPMPNFDLIPEFSVSALPEKDYGNPILNVIKNPIRYFYYRHDGIDIPLMIEDMVLSEKTAFLIKVPGKLEKEFPVKRIHTQTYSSIVISDLIEIKKEEESKKVTLQCQNPLDKKFSSIYEAAKLVLAVTEVGEIQIEHLFFSREKVEPLEKELTRNHLDFYKKIVQIGDLLETIGIDKESFCVIDLLKDEALLSLLVDCLKGKRLAKLPKAQDDFGIFKQKLGGKELILEYEKVGDKGYILRDYLKAGKCIVMLGREKEKEEPQVLSRWFALQGSNLHKILFDEQKLVCEMKKIPDCQIPYLLLLVLDFLKTYDTSREERILCLAETLFAIVEEREPDENIVIINKLQIAARRRELTADERKQLSRIKYSKNRLAGCCACILLQHYDEFEIQVAELSDVERENLYTWPIISLLPGQKESIE